MLLQAQPPLPRAFVAIAGVSKVVTVDVKGNWQRWLKVRDLTKGVTYFFRVQARTIAYGPELQANVTAGPAEGEWAVLITEQSLIALTCFGIPALRRWRQEERDSRTCSSSLGASLG